MSEIAPSLTVRSLVCHHHVDMAIACLGSLLKFSAEPVRLVIHDDGSLTDEDAKRLRRELKGSTILFRAEADELMNQLLKAHPCCYQYRSEQVYGLKLLDIALLSQSDIAYCDSDILFFQPFEGMFRWTDSETSAIFMEDRLDAYSIHPQFLTDQQGIKLPRRVNAGLMFVRQKAYDLDFIEWLLGKDEMRYIPIWTEQTCWAALGHRISCQLWEPQQVLLMRPGTKVTDKLVAGHFTSRVRYLLKEFLPKANCISGNSKPVKVETIPSLDCSALNLAHSQFKRKIRIAQQQALYKLRGSFVGRCKRILEGVVHELLSKDEAERRI